MHKCCNKLLEYYTLLTRKYHFFAIIVTELQHTTDNVPSTHLMQTKHFQPVGFKQRNWNSLSGQKEKRNKGCSDFATIS